MRILCEFYTKGKSFVRIRLEERFPSAFKIMKIHMHKLRRSSQDKCKKINFISLPKFHNP
jgi:hypothetical protein